MESKIDIEIEALRQVIGALEPLDREARARVLGYAFNRLGIDRHNFLEVPAGSSPSAAAPQAPVLPSAPADIRSLQEEKKPDSDTAMAAIVGYYLADLAPETDRKREITTADIEKYFKQAGYPLPGVPRKTLPNAAAAGYFDSKGSARYALNPVGHNLVTHGLPRASSPTASPRRRTKAATGGKAKSKKKVAKTRSAKRKTKRSRKK